MRVSVLLFFTISIIVGSINIVLAEGESIEMGVSVDTVPVASDFDGTNIVVFGSIEGIDDIAAKLGHYQVVVTVTGAPEDTIVRKKDRIFGIWVNRDHRKYTRIPSFYATASRIKLGKIAIPEVLREAGIGIENLNINLLAEGNIETILPTPQFTDALRRIRTENGLFSEAPKNLKQLSPSLFRATVFLPPNVPIGTHEVRAFLFKSGELRADSKSSFRIQKVGFERWMYNIAHKHSFLYGIMCVLVAIFTGWAANAIFRKN